MKFILLLLIPLVFSCAPLGPEDNPLDTPDTVVIRPESMGRFGPHSEYYR